MRCWIKRTMSPPVPCTRREVAAWLGVAHARVEEIEAAALLKIRAALEAKLARRPRTDGD